MSISAVQLSQVKNINFGNNQTESLPVKINDNVLSQDTVEINGEKKGLSKNAKWGIGIGAAAIITAAALLQKQLKKLVVLQELIWELKITMKKCRLK